MTRRLVCGLGNPGKRYIQTRHNVGFMAIDRFCVECGNAGFTQIWDSEVTMVEYGGLEVYLQKPQTFVNLSGVAVAKALKALSLAPQDLLLIHDDFALPFGRIRVSFDSSDGGHKGVRSVISELGTKGFSRVRVGIAPANRPSQPLEEFVLSPFTPEEAENLGLVLGGAVLATQVWLLEGVRRAQDAINGKSFLGLPSCPSPGRRDLGPKGG